MTSRSQLKILTPEHVEIFLTPAGIGSRFLAVLLDGAIVLALNAALHWLLGPLLPASVSTAATGTLFFVLNWGYHVYFEIKQQGRSPGKRFVGLRVVDARGLPITFAQSFLRNIVRALDFLPAFYGVGGIVSLFHPERRRLGDIVADTLVIREAQPLAYGGQLSKAPRFNSLENPRTRRLIRHRIGLEEREFLLTLCLRAERLESTARFDLMEKVGGHYREVLGVDDPSISGENLVRGLTAVLYGQEATGRR